MKETVHIWKSLNDENYTLWCGVDYHTSVIVLYEQSCFYEEVNPEEDIACDVCVLLFFANNYKYAEGITFEEKYGKPDV